MRPAWTTPPSGPNCSRSARGPSRAPSRTSSERARCRPACAGRRRGAHAVANLRALHRWQRFWQSRPLGRAAALRHATRRRQAAEHAAAALQPAVPTTPPAPQTATATPPETTPPSPTAHGAAPASKRKGSPGARAWTTGAALPSVSGAQPDLAQMQSHITGPPQELELVAWRPQPRYARGVALQGTVARGGAHSCLPW